MRPLLDTQIMLWWLLDDPRLRPDTRKLIAATPCLVSVASVWEVAIRHRLGKLPLAPDLFRDQSVAAGASILPILEGHVIETAHLPAVHEDPFDRLLIAQVLLEGPMAVSSDSRWSGYEVSLHRVQAREPVPEGAFGL